MLLCANENLPLDCVVALRAAGHDVMWVRESMPGSGDEVVLDCARTEGRVLLTFDKDFGELVFLKGKSASNGIIHFRISQPSPGIVAAAVVGTVSSRQDWGGHFSVVDNRTVRMRALR